MRKTFQYKAKLSKSVERKAFNWLYLCRNLYNTCLEQRMFMYTQRKIGISGYEQAKELPFLKKEFPEYKEVNSQTLQAVTEKLQESYNNFFRRLKRGETPGFPRFKGKDRYNSFVLKQSGWKLEKNNLTIKNIGRFKLFLSRPVLGDIKTITVKYTSNGWFISFSCNNVPLTLLPQTGKEVGIDVGLKVFLADSDGEFVKNPKFFKESEKELRIRQRSLSRKKKGSSRRKKCKKQVSKCYTKIKNRRLDFANKLAKKYVDSNNIIYVENLKIKNMVQNKHLSKSISDVAWGLFRQKLEFKAEEAGRLVIAIDPRNTSQTCLCGEMVPKTLAVRLHSCPVCNLEMDRDTLAAKNILRFGQSLRVLTKPLGLVAR
jgi:putative transposase